MTVNNITGSDDTDFDISKSGSFAILGSATNTLGGSSILGKFHYYKITEERYFTWVLRTRAK